MPRPPSGPPSRPRASGTGRRRARGARSRRRTLPACSTSSRRMPAPSWRVLSRVAALPGPASTSFAIHASSGSFSWASPPASQARRALTAFRALVFSGPLAASIASSSGPIRPWAAPAHAESAARSLPWSLRSSRMADSRTSSRTFFGSSPAMRLATSVSRPPARTRASSRVGIPCSSAHVESVRAQYSSSSSKFFVGTVDQVLAAALHALLERGERLLAVELQPLALLLHLALELGDVTLARLLVDRGHDRGREVEHLLELLRSDVEQVADARRDALEEPDVADRRGQVDVAHPLAAHLLARHLDAAALADDALVADALVLAAVALPVLRGTEDALAEQAVLLGLERAVVDGLGLGHLPGGPLTDLLRRGEADTDCVEIVDVDQRVSSSSYTRERNSGATLRRTWLNGPGRTVIPRPPPRRARGRRCLRSPRRPPPPPPRRPWRRGRPRPAPRRAARRWGR